MPTSFPYGLHTLSHRFLHQASFPVTAMTSHPAFLPPAPLSISTSFSLPRPTRRPLFQATLQTTATSLVPRSDFPILHQKVHEHPLVYLDSAATSQKPLSVIDALTGYYDGINANVHRGAHELAARATDAYEATRDKIANLINARRNNVVFVRNATEGINLVAHCWGRHNLKRGDKILVSVMEHHANLVPWQMLAEETGAKVIPIPLSEDEGYNIAALKEELDKGKVKLVACNHVSNVLGCLNPVEEIAALAHDKGATVLLDACQSVPHMPVDVQKLGCDFLVASAHKMCGPTGVGFLWGRNDLLESMPPYMGGGEMISDVFLDRSTYACPPHKFEAGTPAIGEIVAFGAAIDYLNKFGMDEIHRFEIELGEYLWERLTAFREVRVYGPKPPRAALCAFNIDGVHSSDLATMLDLEGVAVRSGHHCAQPLHRELGVPSSARASLYIYNTRDEVDALIEAMKSSVDLLGATLTLG